MLNEIRPTKVSYEGVRFGKLLAIKRIRNKSKKGTYISYSCLCDCGNSTEVNYFNLKNGNTKSCGCNRSEGCIKREAKKNHPKHGVVLSYYKRNAKIRNIEWQLALEDFLILIKGACVYCSFPPTKRMLVGKEVEFNGIDRIDNSRGYTLDNCVSCCSVCNLAKHTQTLPNFLTWIEAVWNNKERISKLI